MNTSNEYVRKLNHLLATWEASGLPLPTQMLRRKHIALSDFPKAARAMALNAEGAASLAFELLAEALEKPYKPLPDIQQGLCIHSSEKEHGIRWPKEITSSDLTCVTLHRQGKSARLPVYLQELPPRSIV
jgi:hypothetical protein